MVEVMLRVVSFGGGVNSSALLVGLVERGTPPNLILFADTGDEFEETYAHVRSMDAWSRAHLGLGITTVRRAYPRHLSLENECHNLGTLPSKAFGFSGCSVKWKRQPMDRYIRLSPTAQMAWARGERIERLIGIDAGEQHRGKIPDDDRYVYRYPLIEWDWAREECLAAIRRAGIAVPRKSACFFCPATKKAEVLELARSRPDLFARAVAIEDQAREKGGIGQGTTRGLGRTWTWRELVEAADPGLLPETPFEHCNDCIDGIGED